MKQQTIVEYKIKIRRIRDVNKIGKGDYEYTDKMFLVDIKNSYGGGIGFSIKIGNHYGKSLKKVFREIIEQLHL